MNIINKADFFRKGSIQVNKLAIGEYHPSGGIESGYFNADVTLVWDEVSLIGSTYSGKGKLIFNKDIPHFSFPNYKFPAQEIPFEFHKRERLMH